MVQVVKDQGDYISLFSVYKDTVNFITLYSYSQLFACSSRKHYLLNIHCYNT